MVCSVFSKTVFLAASALAVLSGCIGGADEETKASLTAKVKMASKAMTTEQVAGASPTSLSLPSSSSGANFLLKEARVNVRHIELDFPEGKVCPQESGYCKDSNTIAIEGPFLVNLLTGAASPSIPAVPIPFGLYKRVDIRLDDTKLDDKLVSQDDPLLGMTFMAKGTFDYDSKTGRIFTIRLKFNEDSRFENAGGIDLTGTQAQELLLALDIGKWLNGVDLIRCLDDNNLDLDSEGNLTVDEGSGKGGCQGIEGLIKKNIKESGIFRAG